MYQNEWRKLEEELRAKYGAGKQTWETLEIPESAGVRVRSNRVADKGAEGFLRSYFNGTATIETDDGRKLTMTIIKIDRIDANGNILTAGAKDMLGADLCEGNFVAYSQSAGRSGHMMMIGRIKSFTNRGTIEIEPKVQNGKKPGWNSKDTVDPDRCVKLPVDEDRMMMAILTDFASIDGRHD